MEQHKSNKCTNHATSVLSVSSKSYETPCQRNSFVAVYRHNRLGINILYYFTHIACTLK